MNLMPICRPEWREDKLRRRTFEIGTSNILVGFYQEDENQDMVLVRINGNELVNRDQELLALLTMHKVGLSPPIYCQFGNGLCYGFVPGRVVELEELYQLEMSCRIARALGRLHSISIPSLGKQATAFQMIDRLLQKIPQDRTQTHQFHRLYGPWEQLKSEVGIVKVELSKLQSTMVFCHNDPQHNNIIYNAKMGTVTFIDFEYAGMNWRAFDLAAYFGEFPGLAYESCRYPSEKFQKMFIRTYLEEVAEQGGKSLHTLSTGMAQCRLSHSMSSVFRLSVEKLQSSLATVIVAHGHVRIVTLLVVGECFNIAHGGRSVNLIQSIHPKKKNFTTNCQTLVCH